MLFNCEKCGSPLDNCSRTSKCSKCENIKFDREFFDTIINRFSNNFIQAKETKYGSILKKWIVFGSYVDDATEYGDIDILVTYSNPKLKKLVVSEMRLLRNGLCKIWNFNECQEYPDCLECFHDNNDSVCDKDFHKKIHNYCLDNCSYPNRQPYPLCKYGYKCNYPKTEIYYKILEIVKDTLENDIQTHFELKPNFTIKILDLQFNQSINSFIKNSKIHKFRY